MEHARRGNATTRLMSGVALPRRVRFFLLSGENVKLFRTYIRHEYLFRYSSTPMGGAMPCARGGRRGADRGRCEADRGERRENAPNEPPRAAVLARRGAPAERRAAAGNSGRQNESASAAERKPLTMTGGRRRAPLHIGRGVVFLPASPVSAPLKQGARVRSTHRTRPGHARGFIHRGAPGERTFCKANVRPGWGRTYAGNCILKRAALRRDALAYIIPSTRSPVKAERSSAT